MALARKGRLAEAEKEFLASLAINPPHLVTVPDYSSSALANLGNIYLLRGDLARAKTCYEMVLRYDRNNHLASQNLAILRKMEREGQEEGPRAELP
jgi:Flp pilus assembly protein TadD